MINGASDHPLKLFPAYERLKAARGVQKYSASELFFPSLDVFSLPANVNPAVGEADLPAFVKAQRARYELGLLKWLRGATQDGLLIMRQTLDAISQAVKSPRQRALSGGPPAVLSMRFSTMRWGGLRCQADICPNQHSAAPSGGRFANRCRPFAARYPVFLAKSQPTVDSVRQIKKSFALDELMPAAITLEQGDAATILKIAREAKELLNQAKGKPGFALPAVMPIGCSRYAICWANCAKRAKVCRFPGLPAPFHALSGAIDSLSGAAVPESAAMDVATAFLLLEGIYDRPLQQSPDLPEQLDAMTRRLMR